MHLLVASQVDDWRLLSKSIRDYVATRGVSSLINRGLIHEQKTRKRNSPFSLQFSVVTTVDTEEGMLSVLNGQPGHHWEVHMVKAHDIVCVEVLRSRKFLKHTRG